MKRYDKPTVEVNGEDITVELEEHVYGEYVEYSDYEELETQLEEAEGRASQLQEGLDNVRY